MCFFRQCGERRTLRHLRRHIFIRRRNERSPLRRASHGVEERRCPHHRRRNLVRNRVLQGRPLQRRNLSPTLTAFLFFHKHKASLRQSGIEIFWLRIRGLPTSSPPWAVRCHASRTFSVARL